MKLNKNKILLQLLKDITEYSDLDSALLNTLSQLKINQDRFYEIKHELFPKGLSSLMNELNLIINEIITQEKNQLDLKTLRLTKKLSILLLED